MKYIWLYNSSKNRCLETSNSAKEDFSIFFKKKSADAQTHAVFVCDVDYCTRPSPRSFAYIFRGGGGFKNSRVKRSRPFSHLRSPPERGGRRAGIPSLHGPRHCADVRLQSVHVALSARHPELGARQPPPRRTRAGQPAGRRCRTRRRQPLPPRVPAVVAPEPRPLLLLRRRRRRRAERVSDGQRRRTSLRRPVAAAATDDARRKRRPHPRRVAGEILGPVRQRRLRAAAGGESADDVERVLLDADEPRRHRRHVPRVLVRAACAGLGRTHRRRTVALRPPVLRVAHVSAERERLGLLGVLLVLPADLRLQPVDLAVEVPPRHLVALEQQAAAPLRRTPRHVLVRHAEQAHLVVQPRRLPLVLLALVPHGVPRLLLHPAYLRRVLHRLVQRRLLLRQLRPPGLCLRLLRLQERPLRRKLLEGRVGCLRHLRVEVPQRRLRLRLLLLHRGHLGLQRRPALLQQPLLLRDHPVEHRLLRQKRHVPVHADHRRSDHRRAVRRQLILRHRLRRLRRCHRHCGRHRRHPRGGRRRKRAGTLLGLLLCRRQRGCHAVGTHRVDVALDARVQQREAFRRLVGPRLHDVRRSCRVHPLLCLRLRRRRRRRRRRCRRRRCLRRGRSDGSGVAVGRRRRRRHSRRRRRAALAVRSLSLGLRRRSLLRLRRRSLRRRSRRRRRRRRSRRRRLRDRRRSRGRSLLRRRGPRLGVVPRSRPLPLCLHPRTEETQRGAVALHGCLGLGVWETGHTREAGVLEGVQHQTLDVRALVRLCLHKHRYLRLQEPRAFFAVVVAVAGTALLCSLGGRRLAGLFRARLLLAVGGALRRCILGGDGVAVLLLLLHLTRRIRRCVARRRRSCRRRCRCTRRG
eukprot:Rhum_TRINITY_DN14235_c6_g1::Rhum_TRINITY_DN14235_c6_g1_i1::g.74591::m.74591